MDYALPRADDLPSFDLDFNGTRCTTNPLGVKGCGEAGAVGDVSRDRATPSSTRWRRSASPASTGPATPFRIWQAMHGLQA